jgi:hypothetical protein
LRVEVSEDQLLALTQDQAKRELLRNAHFLGVTASDTHASQQSAFQALKSLRTDANRFVDFRGPWGYPDPALLSSLAEKTLRLRWHLSDLQGLNLPDYGSQFQARLDVMVTFKPPLLVGLRLLMETLAQRQYPATVKLHISMHSDSEPLFHAWHDVEEWSRSSGIGVRAPYLGLACGPKPELPGLSGPAILEQAIRSIMARRPSACPFPFLMLRIDSEETMGVCPNEQGPSLTPAGDPWNDPAIKKVREEFYAGLLKEPGCKTCLLLPRVRRSLAELGDLGKPPSLNV